MKKLFIVLLTTLLSVSLLSQNTSNNNKVYWVHGLGDKSSVWNVYKNALVAEGNRGTSSSWSMFDELASSANQLNYYINYTDRQLFNGKKAIVFGHSAGGLIARQAALRNNRIRAVITAGTPNNGTRLGWAINDNSIYNAADNVIRSLQTSLSIGSVAANALLPGMGSAIVGGLGFIAANVGGEVGSCFAKKAIDDYLTDFKGSQAVSDMIPGSAFLNGINTTPTVPIINIYGKEDGNRLIRLAGSAVNKENIDSPDNGNDQSYDEAFMPFYNGLLGTSIGLQVLHYSAGATATVLGFWYPYLFAAAALNYSAGACWTSSHRVMQYDVHNDWDKIIGAYHEETHTDWHRFLWWTWTTSYVVPIYENSDGFIPNNSSKMDASKGPRTTNIEIPGVNHLEMNSNINMRDILRRILTTNEYGEEFNPTNN
ncbi:MAG: alpha/beta hydrolase [Bacteroidales bacterium]|nr:alpha/beta hydrolase [Bacteroidales bacterium]MBQ9597111.1 alpha/beta hydrolase [Bacteroidales bacterium]